MEGSLPSVSPHMDLVPVLVYVAPLAVGADQRVVYLVSLLVDGELVFGGANFRADFAPPLQGSVIIVRRLQLALPFVQLQHDLGRSGS